MNVTETSAEGLRRQLTVVIGAEELEQRLSARLDELKGKARLKGFRPGHVPKEHLRKVYGRSVMAEVVQQAVAETSREALSQREDVTGSRVLYATAQGSREVLPDGLMTLGADVEVVHVYRSVPDPAAAAPLRAALEKGDADVVTFTSASTVRGHGLHEVAAGRLEVRLQERQIVAAVLR